MIFVNKYNGLVNFDISEFDKQSLLLLLISGKTIKHNNKHYKIAHDKQIINIDSGELIVKIDKVKV